jgi:hypothetical protein
MRPLDSILFIGQNQNSNWVVTDRKGLRGGLFANRDAAFRYAMWENGRRPEAIAWVTGPLELDVGDKKGAESPIAAFASIEHYLPAPPKE